MNRIGVLTSGGDAPGMNAAVRAVVRTGIYHELEIYGIRFGFQGLLQKTWDVMVRGSVADIIHRGGTVLQTARCEEFKQKEGRAQAGRNLRELGIEGLIVIGGDGSLQGAQLLAAEQGIKVIGIPATIDNDIGGTDYSIGFDTAMNTVLDAVNKIRDTATSHERIFVVEVMGRESGFLTLYAGLAAGAESIIIPEKPIALENIYAKLEHGFKRGKKHSIIMIAEGVGGCLPVNRDYNQSKAFALGEAIRKRTGHETRIIILGHLQRGGTPSGRDRIMASCMGAQAVELLRTGESNLMTALIKDSHTSIAIESALAKPNRIDEELLELANILSM